MKEYNKCGSLKSNSKVKLNFNEVYWSEGIFRIGQNGGKVLVARFFVIGVDIPIDNHVVISCWYL
jgi:hypothetical protein